MLSVQKFLIYHNMEKVSVSKTQELHRVLRKLNWSSLTGFHVVFFPIAFVKTNIRFAFHDNNLVNPPCFFSSTVIIKNCFSFSLFLIFDLFVFLCPFKSVYISNFNRINVILCLKFFIISDRFKLTWIYA